MPAQSAKPRAAARKKSTKTKTHSAPKLSQTRMPVGMDVADWQRALRAQFGREQPYALKNIGSESLFSDYLLSLSDRHQSYRVAIRGSLPGANFCGCADFATNALGTCKHIEFTLVALLKKRGAKAAFKAGYAPVFSELYVHYGEQRSVRFRMGSDCSPVLQRYVQTLIKPITCELPATHFSEVDKLRSAAADAGHELRCYDDALTLIAAARDRTKRLTALSLGHPTGAASPALRKLLRRLLYDYQAEGAWFAATAGRALLGDEMGFGKTVQAVAATELLIQYAGVSRVLVICPTSLKTQWQQEIERFTKHKAQIIGGMLAQRTAQFQSINANDKKKTDKQVEIKITNYDTVARDLSAIVDFAPDVLIVDEAQRVKNWNTIAARAVKQISSPYAFVLTGTPLENKLEELISVVQLVDQHVLGPTWRVLHEHQSRDESGRVIGYKNLNALTTKLAPVMIRRRKSEVLTQLPPRVEQTLMLPMTVQQMQHHTESRDVVARIVQRWKRTGFLSDSDQRLLTVHLQLMRMSCNSTYLLDGVTDFGTKADEIVSLLEQVLSEPGNKVVIFSQWLRSHEILIRRLDANGWGYVSFHGSVPSPKRPALIERFKTDPDCRVFIATDAGSVGLNLQHAAATVINMDMPWNPAVLEQRVGRVHRMGQTRSVQVINLVAAGTIEEGMLSLLSFKKSLFAGVLDGGASDVFLDGTRLSQFMAGVERATSAINEASVDIVATRAPADPLNSQAQTSGGATSPATESAQAFAIDDAAPEVPGSAVPSDIATFATDESAEPPIPSRPASANPWAPLIQAGVDLLNTLAEAQSNPAAAAPAYIAVDTATGERYLRLPLPSPTDLQRLLESLGQVLRR